MRFATEKFEKLDPPTEERIIFFCPSLRPLKPSIVSAKPVSFSDWAKTNTLSLINKNHRIKLVIFKVELFLSSNGTICSPSSILLAVARRSATLIFGVLCVCRSDCHNFKLHPLTSTIT